MADPAPPGSPAEGVQVAALAALASLGAGPEAGLLGCGWPALLRTLSDLHARQVGQVSSELPALAPLSGPARASEQAGDVELDGEC